jgi:hypothetical protein
MCNDEFPGSKFCTSKEIFETPGPLPAISQPLWVHPYFIGIAGADHTVDYSGAIGAPQNLTCVGWSNNTSSWRGFLILEDGSIQVGGETCDNQRHVACCAPVQ